MSKLKSLPTNSIIPRGLRLGACLFAASAMLLLSGQASFAQKFKELPINEKFDATKIESLTGTERRDAERARNDMISEFRGIALQSLKGASDVSVNQGKFDGWFQQVVIPEMTLSDRASLRLLPERRVSFFKMYFLDPNGSSSGNATWKRNAQARLARDIAFPMFSEIVMNNDAVSYAREVKINALLAIGELNLAEGRHAENPPVPLPQALPFLLGQFNAADTPDYMKAIALIGIQRHALLDAQLKSNQVADADRNQIKALCVELLGDKPEDRADDLHYWMQRKAAGIAGAYGDPVAADALAKIMADSEARLWLRCEAASAYAKLQFAAPADAKGAQSAQEIGKVALKALRDELAFLEGEKLRLAELEIKRRHTPPVAIESVATTGGKVGGGGAKEMEEMMKKMGKGGGEDNQQEKQQMNMEDMMKMMKDSKGGRGGRETESDKERRADEPKPMRRSKFGHVANSAEELPAYKLDITRRRLKTVAMYLDSAVGADAKNGISRYCTEEDALATVNKLRTHIKDIEFAAHMGVDDRYEAMTPEMISTLAQQADLLASDLGIVEEVPAAVEEEPAAEGKPAEVADEGAEDPAAKGVAKTGAGKAGKKATGKAPAKAPAKKAAEAVDEPFGLE